MATTSPQALTTHRPIVDPPPSSELASRRMRNTRSRDTPPELAIRRLLRARGLRYRVDARPVQGLNRRADLVFGPARLAVFVDGCFWHSCPEHGSAPKANRVWWAEKLRANVERDRDTNARLIAAGWTVLRIWEHMPPEAATEIVATTVAELRPRSTPRDHRSVT
ncbi:DNA mismatch endonuclease Vsr [Rathayibacter toxicus]|uniref:DNA mismatch endonuclease Vsr n=2 Tax=Rathayibacter toxicus TaxID=145458 RepID=UPI00358E2FEC